MNTSEDNKIILRILSKIDIPDKIKGIILKNIDELDKEKLLVIFDKYISKIEELNINKKNKVKELNKKILDYEIKSSRIKELSKIDDDLDKELDSLIN